MMSQFLTINKLEGHMIVKQGVSIVKVINKDFEFLTFFCILLYLQISIPRTTSDTGTTHFAKL